VLTGTGLGHMYWTNIFSGTVEEANIDGTSPLVVAAERIL